MTQITVGVSGCVLGEKVRYDGGHKHSRFVTDELANFFDFMPICPEVGMGLPVPRSTIRLVQHSDVVRLVDSKESTLDHTDKMQQFADSILPNLADLCGYIVCAKSPTCGMERVKLYLDNGNTVPGGTRGLFTERLMTTFPWLPVEEDGRLNDPVLKENFVTRVFALHDLYESTQTLTRQSLVDFHSRYKLTLMAHNQSAYRSLGKMVANIKDWELNDFFLAYREAFMTALTERASKKNNANVLMHIQGYFKQQLTAGEKTELSDLILQYRRGDLPILAVLTLIQHYLRTYPSAYLSQQQFLHPHPNELRLRLHL
jgi:uncharacterized protein YbgA (DUF1722 family)/uncharacterized protein YbbK (DUF523 family)